MIEAIKKLLEKSAEMMGVCLKDGNKKPGILYISKNTELSSLGLLESSVNDWDDMEIRIVPVLHGG